MLHALNCCAAQASKPAACVQTDRTPCIEPLQLKVQQSDVCRYAMIGAAAVTHLSSGGRDKWGSSPECDMLKGWL